MTESLTSRVVQMVNEFNSVTNVTVATTLESLGWDTDDRMDFADELTDEFEQAIADDASEQWSTVQDIVNTVVQAVGGTEAV